MNFTDAERALFAEFNTAQIRITRDGTATKGPRNEPIPGIPVEVLPLQGCQLWDLSESDKTGLTGEEIALRRKVRLSDYHDNLTEKMTAFLDGKAHNIVLCSDDGTRSFSLLTLRLIKS
ncbi:hypothetical protein EON83_25855 [bacterium]|nr:MAG: hypothetical protein EON83_25855 [bacterium]